MKDQQYLHFLGRLPEWIKRRIVEESGRPQIGGDLSRLEAVATGRALHHRDGGLGVLKRHIGGPGITVRIASHHARDGLVLQLGKLDAEVKRHRIAGKIHISGQHLHVDALGIHGGDALRIVRQRHVHGPRVT